jgi:LPXTG-motif cell wall-anchored protein
MKKALVFAAVAMLGVAAFGAASTGGVGATNPDDEGEHKVWICHATAGLGELKNGYDLIEVDVASTKYQAHLAHATTDPKKNSTFGVLYDKIDVGEGSDCGGIPTKDDKVEYTEWIGPQPSCIAQSVEQTRTVTTYSYTFDPVASKYVEKATTTEETRTLSLTPEEVAKCNVPEEKSLPPVVPPPGGTTPAVVTPAVAPPAVVTPAVQAAGATVAAAPTSLPTTGGETWTIFLIGLATLLTGAGLVTLSRRTA